MAAFVVLDLQLARLAYNALDEIFADSAEPMPPWEDGDHAVIDMCCKSPEVEAFGEQKYPDLPSKAAKLFYSTIKNHPFANGNKRFALVLVIAYLVANEHRLTAPEGLAYETAKGVAEADPHTRWGGHETLVNELIGFFREYIEPFKWRAAFADLKARSN